METKHLQFSESEIHDQLKRRLELLASLQNQEHLPALQANDALREATISQHYRLLDATRLQILSLPEPEQFQLLKNLHTSLPFTSLITSSPTTSDVG